MKDGIITTLKHLIRSLWKYFVLYNVRRTIVSTHFKQRYRLAYFSPHSFSGPCQKLAQQAITNMTARFRWKDMPPIGTVTGKCFGMMKDPGLRYKIPNWKCYVLVLISSNLTSWKSEQASIKQVKLEIARFGPLLSKRDLTLAFLSDVLASKSPMSPRSNSPPQTSHLPQNCNRITAEAGRNWGYKEQTPTLTAGGSLTSEWHKPDVVTSDGREVTLGAFEKAPHLQTANYHYCATLIKKKGKLIPTWIQV